MNAVSHFAELKDLRPRSDALPAALVQALRERFGERMSLARAVREHHGTDISSYLWSRPPMSSPS